MSVEDPVRFVDERLGATSVLRKYLRYVFPDHWSFMLGEIALYAFVVLVGTGVFLAFFYVPSDAEIVYSGVYEPLRGTTMTEAYHSVVELSLDVPAGLLMRQTHHWAANVFMLAIVLHMVRILFTGAFRKPREINYVIGVTMLTLGLLEGFLGYSLIDDLLSGMGLVIAYAVALSIPFVGADFATVFWDGQYPGATVFWTRMFTLHVFVLPAALATLIALHLASIMRQHHTQFPGPRRTQSNVVGTPMWPAYALRSGGLFFIMVGLLFLLGGLVQINPVWLWGPYEPWLSMNGAHPDWYVGWLIGALRMMPPLELQVWEYTIAPNPLWGGLLFPLIVFAVLYLWPLIDRRFSVPGQHHELLDRPRDNPRRSAALCGFLAFVVIPFLAGASDRLFFRMGISYEAQMWFFRIFIFAGPILVWAIALRVFKELNARGGHPLRGTTGRVVRRREDGGFETLAVTDGKRQEVLTGAAAEEPRD